MHTPLLSWHLKRPSLGSPAQSWVGSKLKFEYKIILPPWRISCRLIGISLAFWELRYGFQGSSIHVRIAPYLDLSYTSNIITSFGGFFIYRSRFFIHFAPAARHLLNYLSDLGHRVSLQNFCSFLIFVRPLFDLLFGRIWCMPTLTSWAGQRLNRALWAFAFLFRTVCPWSSWRHHQLHQLHLIRCFLRLA